LIGGALRFARGQNRESRSESLRVVKGGAEKKNKCGPGQPPKPHCYRGYSDRRLSLSRKIIAQQHSEECYAAMFYLRLSLQGYDPALLFFSEEEL
jgi:hypothetical protein